MLTALLVLAAVCLFVNLVAILVILGLNIVVARDVRDILTLEKLNTVRLAAIDKNTVTTNAILATMMTTGYPLVGGGLPPLPSELGEPGRNPRELFETEDGRHQASSLQELMEKVKNDPKYKTTNPDDIEKLKDLFGKATDGKPPKPPKKEKPPTDDGDFPELLGDDEDDPNVPQ